VEFYGGFYMTYAKKLQSWCRYATVEYVPATRILYSLSESELADRAFVIEHLKNIGLPEMSGVVRDMSSTDYLTFIEDIEDTSDDELH
jgi:hypothetical protein